MSHTKIVIAAGDPAGCGPFITLKAIELLDVEPADFFVVGDKKIFEEIPFYQKIKNRINLIDLNTPKIEKIKKGYVSKLGGQASLSYLVKSLEVLKKNGIKRLVTAPLSKESVQLVLPKFSGHTEYLADYFNSRNFAMMMVSGKLKTILLTRHIPLRKVSVSLNKKEVLDIFSLVYSSLKTMFKIKNPRIVVASLNPHAGINTFLDKEEKLIYKAIKEFKHEICGPYPADSIFIEDNLKKYDCVISLYHDQGMIAFKLLSLKQGVNLTLGLPIIRTSPAHGVAYDVIRQHKLPFSSSMVEAIRLAMRLNI